LTSADARVKVEDPPKETFAVDFIALHGINGGIIAKQVTSIETLF
jgi:hypothetical protein